jgi:hypothetical protein
MPLFSDALYCLPILAENRVNERNPVNERNGDFATGGMCFRRTT